MILFKKQLFDLEVKVPRRSLRYATHRQGLLWLQKCWRQKNRQVSNSVASSKKSEPENLEAITCSHKIVLRSSMQISSLMTPALKSWYCQKGKCYVYYDLFCYTGRFVYFGAIFMLKMKQIFVWEQQAEVYLHLLRIVTYHDWHENRLLTVIRQTAFFSISTVI